MTRELDIRDATARVHEVQCQLTQAYLSQCQLGIPFLDDVLISILPTDLVLVGASSGKGKTALSIEIAKSNAMKKKKVLLFALEAEKNEVEMRLLYQIESGLYFKGDLHKFGARMDYRPWRLGMLDNVLEPVKARAMEIFQDRYKTLTTVYRDEQFSIDDLEHTLRLAEGNQDLVVIDHFSYISSGYLGLGKKSSQQLETDMITRIRNLNLFHKVPFVMAVHVRKERKSVIPTQEDIMGSSDIYKNATVIAMLTPRPQGYNAKEQVQETIVTVPKTRTGGIGDLCGILYFKIPYQGYSPKFSVGRVDFKGDNCQELEKDEWPEWLKQKG